MLTAFYRVVWTVYSANQLCSINTFRIVQIKLRHVFYYSFYGSVIRDSEAAEVLRHIVPRGMLQLRECMRITIQYASFDWFCDGLLPITVYDVLRCWVLKFHFITVWIALIALTEFYMPICSYKWESLGLLPCHLDIAVILLFYVYGNRYYIRHCCLLHDCSILAAFQHKINVFYSNRLSVWKLHVPSITNIWAAVG
jgi:hypothetical protein